MKTELFFLARTKLAEAGIPCPKGDVVIGFGKAAALALGRVKPATTADAYRLVQELVGYERLAPPAIEEPKSRKGRAMNMPDGFSARWLKVRYQALVRDGGRCRCCGASAADGAILHVDHIKPKSRFPELALDLANLQVLCSECNFGKSDTDETAWPVGMKSLCQ